MAYSDSFPATRPVFQADFANGGRVDPRITFSRSDTPPTYAAPSAVHYWSDEKHISSENLFLQSSDFDTSWFPNGINGTPTGGQADPAGGTDGFTVVEDSAVGAIHRIFQAANASGDLAFTVYAKQNSGTRYLTLTLFNANNNWTAATFDLAGGSPATGSGSSSVFTSVSATQTASGNGYYKCTLKATGALAGTAYIYLGSSTAAPAGTYGSVPYTGDGTSSLDIAFASLTTTGASDYQPTTTQIHREYAPTLKSVSTAGQPRFEYSPTDSASEAIGQSRGLLIESQVTNLFPYAENGYNSSSGFTYQNNDVVLTENAGIAPNGQLKATLVTEGTASAGQHRIYRAITTTAANHTASIYAKAVGGLSHIGVRIITGGNTYGSFFNLSDGSASDYGSAPVSSTAEDVGNGWWRFSVTALCASGTSTVYYNCNHNTTGNYTGNGYRGFLFYGLQAELGSHASSWVDTGTSGSTVTRASDSASMDLTQAGYTGGPVSVITETTGGFGSYPRTFSLSDGTITNYANIHRNGTDTDTSTDYRVRLFTDGVSQVDRTASASASATKIGMSIDTNSVTSTFDGGSSATDTSAVINTMTQLLIGDQPTGGKQLNGTLKRVSVYGTALSQTELESLTS